MMMTMIMMKINKTFLNDLYYDIHMIVISCSVSGFILFQFKKIGGFTLHVRILVFHGNMGWDAWGTKPLSGDMCPCPLLAVTPIPNPAGCFMGVTL